MKESNGAASRLFLVEHFGFNWEHHKKKLSTSSSSIAERCSICALQLPLLKNRGVIVGHSDKSHWELAVFFQSIASGYDRGIIENKLNTPPCFMLWTHFPRQIVFSIFWVHYIIPLFLLSSVSISFNQIVLYANLVLKLITIKKITPNSEVS
jgi:hypothetical protein